MAASISGSHHSCCYSSGSGLSGRGSRRCSTTIRSSYAPCSSPASCKPSTTSARIGRKWAELQGARDWAGLLSPLDGALRGELVRYGAFVRAAYASFENAAGEAHSSLQEQVRGEVERIVHEYGGNNGTPPLSVTVTGHSLGAALAVLAAYEITTSSATQQDAAAPMVTAVSFGGPRVGNAAFRRRLEESGCKVLRVVNSNDIVTKVPGFPVDDDDERVSSSSSESSSSSGNTRRRRTRVPRWLVAKMGWAYSDVGRELRLCSEDSASSNVVASHDLDLYLKLVATA
ncbi:hypothetical protein QOZ80_9BG0698100 [Eleusine coracana subsp. coracana]|nr:hypothetical protein QOZ80_9BG0698100 [Eleusine coracana subsp. coracana]